MPNAIRATVRRSVAHGHPHLQRMSRAFSDLVGAFRRSTQVDGLTIVTDEASADRALAELRRLGDRVHAWDTETAEVRPGRRGQTPCHTGRVVCATAFCGDDVDFGQGPMLLVDNVGPAAGLIQRKFHSYFEDSQYKKVFHNYAFDKLMLKREGVTVDGLQADTLILARLHDTSLSSWEGKARREAEGSKAEAMAMGYGQGNPQKVLVPTRAVKGVAFAGKTMDLKSLHTTCIPIEDKAKMQKVATIRRGGYDLKSLAWHYGLAGEEAQGFAELFGAAQDVALKQFDSPDLFPKFALYAARDAVYTYKLFHLLRETLHQTPWNSEAQRRDVAELLLDDQVAEELRRSQRKHTFFTMPRQGNAEAEARGAAGTSGSVQLSTGKTMWDFYNEHLSSRFSECLVNMQERGILLDSTSLQRIEHDASADFQRLRQRFQELLREIRDPQGHCLNPDADKMNLNSSMQLRTLLFGGTKNRASDEELEVSRSFPVSKDSIEAGIKHSKRFELNSWRLTPGRNRKFVTAKGWPSTCKDALEALLNDEDNNVRKQLEELGWSPEMVEKAAEAMQVHRQMASVKNVLTAFAKPMQEHASTQGRLHPSWSYGTSTGRLSCSNPNLQALPSPEKDSYKVRSALKAADGHTFILADYSQLELRILAHVSKCESMKKNFMKGGDYHSEVAAEMYPYIKEAIMKGEVSTSSNERVPTVKSRFPKERSTAKAINFGILYGAGAESIAEDLNISVEQARDLMDAWYESKKAVRRWQADVMAQSSQEGKSRSLLGRHRHLPLLLEDVPYRIRSRSERAAVNFAIQGSGADLVTAAMLQLESHPRLQELGFQLVLQVHDELVLEGPKDGANEAAQIMKDVMQEPFKESIPNFSMRVPLEVSLSISENLSGKA